MPGVSVCMDPWEESHTQHINFPFPAALFYEQFFTITQQHEIHGNLVHFTNELLHCCQSEAANAQQQRVSFSSPSLLLFAPWEEVLLTRLTYYRLYCLF